MVSALDLQSDGPGSRPALFTVWICSQSSRDQIPGHSRKQPAGCPPASRGFQSCHVLFELFVSKYMSGLVPVNLLDKLSVLSTINKPSTSNLLAI